MEPATLGTALTVWRTWLIGCVEERRQSEECGVYLAGLPQTGLCALVLPYYSLQLHAWGWPVPTSGPGGYRSHPYPQSHRLLAPFRPRLLSRQR